jgi:hypothetical protein
MKTIDYLQLAALALTSYITIALFRYAWVNDHMTEMQILKNLHNALLWK